MTQYQAILVQIREDLTAELNSELDDIITEAERDFIIYVLVLVIVVVVCLCLATWCASLGPLSTRVLNLCLRKNDANMFGEVG